MPTDGCDAAMSDGAIRDRMDIPDPYSSGGYNRVSADYKGVMILWGDLTISSEYLGSDLAGLDLTCVYGKITINGAPNLRSLEGLGRITRANKGLCITNNPRLESVKGLANLQIIGESPNEILRIENNPRLTSLCGLEQLTTLKGLSIRTNIRLATISALNQVTQCDSKPAITGNSVLHCEEVTSLCGRVGGCSPNQCPTGR